MSDNNTTNASIIDARLLVTNYNDTIYNDAIYNDSLNIL